MGGVRIGSRHWSSRICKSFGENVDAYVLAVKQDISKVGFASLLAQDLFREFLIPFLLGSRWRTSWNRTSTPSRDQQLAMTSRSEDTLLDLALAGNVTQMKTLLIASERPPLESTIQNLLAAAVKSSHVDVVELLLNQFPSVSLNEEIVRGAVNTGSVPIFKTLLARDPSIINMPFDKRGSPLIVACMGRQTVKYLKFLLEAGADPNQDPDAATYPLALVAALYHDPDVIDLMLRHGARLEHSGSLAAAATLGNEPMLRRLLDRGARVEIDGYSLGARTSPLHVAVKRSRLGVVKILLQHGADPTAVDASGVAAIDVARHMKLEGEDMSQMLEILGEDKSEAM